MLASIVALGIASASSPALADEADEAYAAGSEAAAARDWESAIEHWRAALEQLPGRSAQLDYDLGSAYAQLGDLGRATYHLERALQPEARPSVEVATLARRNLAIVRQQAEVAAEASEARISRPESWWDLAVEILAGPTLGWISMLAGWGVFATVGFRARTRRTNDESQQPKRRVSGAIALVLTAVLVIGGGLHALALAAVADAPEAIVLDPVVDLREGPGAHLPTAVRVQGGSRVRVLEERSGWVHVRMPAGLEGWAPREAVGRLDRPET